MHLPIHSPIHPPTRFLPPPPPPPTPRLPACLQAWLSTSPAAPWWPSPWRARTWWPRRARSSAPPTPWPQTPAPSAAPCASTLGATSSTGEWVGGRARAGGWVVAGGCLWLGGWSSVLLSQPRVMAASRLQASQRPTLLFALWPPLPPHSHQVVSAPCCAVLCCAAGVQLRQRGERPEGAGAVVPRGPGGQRPRAAQPGGRGGSGRFASAVSGGVRHLHLHFRMATLATRCITCLHAQQRQQLRHLETGTSGIKGTPSAPLSGLAAWEISPENSDGMLIRLAAMSPEPPVTLRAYTHAHTCIHPALACFIHPLSITDRWPSLAGPVCAATDLRVNVGQQALRCHLDARPAASEPNSEQAVTFDVCLLRSHMHASVDRQEDVKNAEQS